MLKKIGSMLLSVGITVSVAAASTGGSNETGNAKLKTRKNPQVEIKVVPVGLQKDALERIKQQALTSPAVQKELNGANYYFISLDYLETSDKKGAAAQPEKFRLTFYDYTNQRAVVAQGDISAPERARVYEDTAQPPDVSDEEFAAATKIIEQNSAFANIAKTQKAAFYRPMPPVTVSESGERLVNVGIETRDSSVKAEIISVNLKRSALVRYENAAPPTANAAPTACGIPNAFGQSTVNGTPGQSQVTIVINGVTLWEFMAIRPSASSGTRKSGIEIRDAKYRGKSVLKRGHAPVLNVEYSPNVCGPYRDWQWQEDDFVAPAEGAQNPADGIRILAAGRVATTSLDTGNDAGNFRGVAIYRQNNETILISEMQAGWYRYLMEWRFADDGTIRPRYGFGSVENSCVCNAHIHHVYWRLDFDIVNSKNKVFQIERGRKFQQPITSELTTLRNYQTNKSLLIQNGSGSEAYMLVPNLTDGKADNFGRSDFWVLKYKNVPDGTPLENEIDDGYNFSGGNCHPTTGTCININPFINGESVDNEDVVVWYGAHSLHDEGENLIDSNRNGLALSGSHVVGPDIRPVRW
ncbi:MAG: hypothetical protein M3209_15970 [Acidobacteriota bacterium]|nr:hypothetical protein [Acidobacteriota bacterium]